MMNKLTIRFLALMLLAPAIYAQQAAPGSAAPPVVPGSTDEWQRPIAEPFVRTELFFGTDRLNGAGVSREEFQRFLRKEITPRFPDGLTLLTGTGQFRDPGSNRVIREKSLVLILLYPPGAWKECNEKIEQIRRAYKVWFKQQSVLRVDDPRPVLVSF